MRIAGIMSGTSLDGIDVAIVDIEGKRPGRRAERASPGRRIAGYVFHSRPYPERVRKAILGVSNCATHTGEISRLNFLLGELYAERVRETCRLRRIPLGSIELIGCHGQTIFHQGQGARFLGRPIASTLQIGEAAVLAERTGIPVISDFRTRDMAAGGKGAPLVAFTDYLLFTHPTRSRVAVNIGGIANVHGIPAGARPEDVIAFDTGPGNMVIDALMRESSGGRRAFDRDGRVAARGKVDRALLDELLRDPYYRQRPPKTAGREQYGSGFIERLKATGLAMPDLIATATALTAATIALGIRKFLKGGELIAAGGGVHNPQIMAHLAALLPDMAMATTADFGIDPDAKEAIAFALLAYETWHRRPANLPSATGARRPVILGKITWA
ncbi:MAG: anhydro-N-acetylmuramic acid kinase [Acidobacteria bacterium]|nr:anhydro-N-acetylmuramic acid kinase [Acidobacteriota bacterium]